MPIRTLPLCTLALLGLTGAAFFGHRARALSERLEHLEEKAARADALKPALETTTRELDAVKRAAAALDLKATGLQAELRTTQADLKVAQDRLQDTLKPASVAAAPRPPSGKKPKGGMAAMMAMTRKMMEDPAMKAQIRQEMKPQIEQMYGDFLRELGVEGETRAAIEEALADRMLSGMDLVAVLTDETLSEEEAARRLAEMHSESQTDLAAHLDAGQLQKLQDYDREMPVRIQARMIDQQLAVLKLQPAQQEQVKGVLLEEARSTQDSLQVSMGSGPQGVPLSAPMSVEEVRKARKMMTGQGTEDAGKAVQTMRESQGRSFLRIQPLLTPEQFETFKKQQEAQLQMMEMGLKMMQEMGGGEDGAAPESPAVDVSQPAR